MSKKPALKEITRFRNENALCMKCGFCVSACPVYREELVETSVARGKNALVRGLLSGELDFTPEMEKRLDKCTLCKTCTVNCPAKVDIPSVVIAARADRFKNRGLKFPYNFIYRQILPRRVLFGRTVKTAALAQKLFFPKGSGTLRHLPLFLSGLGHNRSLPQIAPRFLRQSVPVVNKPTSPLRHCVLPTLPKQSKIDACQPDSGFFQSSPQPAVSALTVGYMTGCLTDYVFPELGKKVISFLTHQGVEVIVPREQGCCGAPVFLGAGDFETGRIMADNTVRAFKDLPYVVVDCATCGSAIKDYAKYLADSPQRQKAYAELGQKVIHVTAFLTDILKLPASAYQAVPEAKGKTVTWHDPCHLSRHMGVREQPRRILKSIPDIKFVEMADADRCCGMAGSFSFHFYDLSAKIGDKKLENIVNSGADIVVTGCPGCQIQLMDTIARSQHSVKVMHIMELLE